MLHTCLVLLPPRGSIIRATPLLQKLSWLPIKYRIAFKICVMTFKCINGLAPNYLAGLVKKHKRDSRLRQRANNDLQSFPSRRKIGESSFQTAAPVIWNLLPNHLKTINDLFKFRKELKTHLWRMSFN
jgi:hypothetical protein